jgi:hypothetical protein
MIIITMPDCETIYKSKTNEVKLPELIIIYTNKDGK